MQERESPLFETVITNSVFACSEHFKDSNATDGTVLLDTQDWVLNQNTDNSTAEVKFCK